MDEIELFGFIPNGGRIYCKFYAPVTSGRGSLRELSQTLIGLSLPCLSVCFTIMSLPRTTRPSWHVLFLSRRKSLSGGRRTARLLSRVPSRTRATLWLATQSRTPHLVPSLTLLVRIYSRLSIFWSDTERVVDYQTANDPTLTTPLTDDERADLYSQLASGAESGWDYSTRFVKDPVAGGSNNTNPALRSLNIKSNIPVDLNSILCECMR